MPSGLEPVDVSAACTLGFKVTTQVEVQLKDKNRAALMDLSGHAMQECNEEQLRKVMLGSMTNVQLHRDVQSPGNYTIMYTKNLKKGSPVAAYWGTLMERSKHRHPADSLMHLWAYDLHPWMLKHYSYTGEPLVMVSEACGHCMRYCQDAAWIDGATERNNLEARVELSADPNNGGLPVPLVVMYTTRDVKAGEEGLLDYGKRCLRSCQQILVSKSSSVLES